MPTAGIVIIGDEILTGKFVEENAAFLIGELRALGVDLRRIETIPDDAAEIAETVTRAAARFDHVFTSGGVGPTHDDVTIASIAQGFGVAVVRHPVLEAEIRSYWGAKLDEANLRMADIPDGAELVYRTSAPGRASDAGRTSDAGRAPQAGPSAARVWPVICIRNVYILPGVPTLFRRKFIEIRDRFRSAPVSVARLYVDAEEGSLAADMTAVAAAHPGVRIGSYPRFSETEFRVLVTFEGPLLAEVSAAHAALAARLGLRVVRSEAPRPL